MYSCKSSEAILHACGWLVYFYTHVKKKKKPGKNNIKKEIPAISNLDGG